MRLPCPALTLLLAVACDRALPPPTGSADAVAAARWAGADQPILIQDGVATWPQGSQALGGVVQVVARGDIDGDGEEEALLGVGEGRAARGASTRLWAIGAAGARLLWERDTERDQVSDLAVVGGRIFLAAFADAREVEAGWLLPEGQGWRFQPSSRVAMALRQRPSSAADDSPVVVGRLYGDQPKSDGDLSVRGPDGSVRSLPSLRGVRALATGDLSGDGAPELLVGDGWHFAYGTSAVPRLQLFPGPDWQRGRTIAVLDGDYAVEDIQVLGGDLLVTGSTHVWLLRRDGLGWGARLLSTLPEGGNAVALRTDQGPGALVSGAPVRWVPFAEDAAR